MGSANTPQQEPQYSQTRVNLMLVALFLCLLIAGFGSFKFIPMQGAIMDFFNIAEGAYGVLNTASGWVSVFCAIPMGFLVRKLPCNWSIVIGYAVAICGIIIQVTTGSFVVFVIGRMVEGTGTGLTALVTSTLILNLVPAKRVSFWSSASIMVGILPQVIMAKGGTALMQNSGMSFQTIFLIIAAAYVVAVVVWVILVPFSLHAHGVGSSVKPTKEQTMRVMRNPSALLLAIGHICITLTTITWTAYVIKFLTTKGMDPGKAATVYSYTTILGLISMIVFGLLADKLGTKRKITIVSFLAGALAFVLLAVVPANLIFLYVLTWGTLPRSITGLTSAAVADIAEVPSDVPVVTSVRNTISQIGAIVGGILMGVLIQYCGYEFTIYCLAGVMVVGAVCWYFAKKIP